MSMRVYFTKLLSLGSLMICFSWVHAQSKVGASNEAIGNATSTVSNIWSAWNNPAGIADHEQFSAAISYRSVQQIEGFKSTGIAVALPFKIGAFGLGIYRFGDLLYNEQQIKLSYANKFGITDLGIGLAYHQYHFEGFGNKGVPVISFGGITTITSQFLIGAFIENINQAKLSDFQDERLPTVMQVGISYRPLESIAVNIDIQKDIERDVSVLVGISYAVIENLNLRTGFNSNPSRQFFGLDFNPNNIKGSLSYALSHQQALGYSHQVSIQYDFQTKR